MKKQYLSKIDKEIRKKKEEGDYMSLWMGTYVLVIIMFILALIAQIRVKSVYKRYDRVVSSRGITAEQAVQKVFDYYGVDNVSIVPIAGQLTDNFNPRTMQISLSESVYGKSSIAAIGVACHEAGHAAQYANGYVPIKIRNAFVPICNFGSAFALPIAILGLILNAANMVSIGIILYSFIALFQFLTLPVELNASKRAMKVITETGLMDEKEASGARHVLIAAAMTYVVALATALADLLRFIVIFAGRRD